jgi:trehalose/maltose transport system substrate-binding protein
VCYHVGSIGELIKFHSDKGGAGHRKIQRVITGRIRCCAPWSNSGGMAGAVCIVLLSLFLEGCARPSVQEPVTLTLLEEWTTKTFHEGRQQELQQFTRETGIRVKLLPSPESAREKLALWQELLRTGASGPDVYGIDVIWTRILNEYFIDLKPYFANEISLQFPAITASYTVDNKLVAVAYRADMGLLFYRADLLRQYGYREPPRTWDELEVMAARIQAGERAKGKKEFWGFVWQGGATEALTCNALEWQASEGGGQIIETDQMISVNNPHAIRAWQRAARWVGSISPPHCRRIYRGGRTECLDRGGSIHAELADSLCRQSGGRLANPK